MKAYFIAAAFVSAFFGYSCGESLVDSSFVLKLPDVPHAWETVLGNPHLKLEWVNSHGQKESIVVQGNGGVEISLPPTCVSAVLALPFWPEKDIRSGIFRPAGAIFPHDVSGKTIIASWQGGVDANLFRELAKNANNGNAAIRLPQNFNWPRFRELFGDPTLNADVRADPWLADWDGIAARIVQSGFDRRRLVPEARNSLQLPVGPGPWVGTSPFAVPLHFKSAPAFPVRQAADTWVSAEGVLRCRTDTWVLIPHL